MKNHIFSRLLVSLPGMPCVTDTDCTGDGQTCEPNMNGYSWCECNPATHETVYGENQCAVKSGKLCFQRQVLRGLIAKKGEKSPTKFLVNFLFGT